MFLKTDSVQSSPTIYQFPEAQSPLRAHPFTSILKETLLSPSMADQSFAADKMNTPPDSITHEEVSEETFFDLKPPAPTASTTKIEELMQRLFSADHLHLILADHTLFHRFSAFLNHFKPNLVPTLVRYLEMRKAMKAIDYANSVARAIRWPSHTDYCKFSRVQAAATDVRFEDYAGRELMLLCSDALPAFITHTVVNVVVDMVAKDITGQGVPALQGLVGNLAEVFCLTDPALHDNPIIYASEEFHKTTQYGTTYAIDRNCRFLQGPYTDKNCTMRLAQAVVQGKESNEIILNYRRDGTPFVNLLMCAPLYDDKGVVRYFIGAQIDISGLIDGGKGVESFARLLAKDALALKNKNGDDDQFSQYKPQLKNSYLEKKSKETLDTLQELGAMFSQDEAEVVNRNSRGGGVDDMSETSSIKSGFGVTTKGMGRNQSKRVIGSIHGQDAISGMNLAQLSMGISNTGTANLPGVYKHYLLVRPYPSLQIIFVSPALRLPGLLRTHLFSKLGGPSTTISALEDALRDGASVTAKVLWLPRVSREGEGRGRGEAKARWIRCTPLLGSDDRVGVWMVILVPVENEVAYNHYGGPRRPEMVDEMESERRRFANVGAPQSRAGSIDGESVNLNFHGRSESKAQGRRERDASRNGVGSRMAMREEIRHSRVEAAPEDEEDEEGERQLYASYLRDSGSTGASIEAARRRKISMDDLR